MKRILRKILPGSLMLILALTVFPVSHATAESSGPLDDLTRWLIDSKWETEYIAREYRTQANAKQTGRLTDLLPETKDDVFHILHLEVRDTDARLFLIDSKGIMTHIYRRSSADILTAVMSIGASESSPAQDLFSREWEYITDSTALVIRGFSADLSQIERKMSRTPEKKGHLTDMYPSPSAFEDDGEADDPAFMMLMGGDDPVIDWNRLLGTNTSQGVEGVSAEDADTIYITGPTSGAFDGQSHPGGQSPFLTKYAGDGSKIWTRIWGSASNDFTWGVSANPSDGIYVVGETRGAFHGQSNAGSLDPYLTKNDSDGSLIWSRIWGTASMDNGRGVHADGTNGVFVAGYTGGALDGQSNTGGFDFFVTKHSTGGTRLWSRLRGSTSTEVGWDVSVDKDGNIYVIGTAFGAFDGQTYAGAGDAALVKYNASGVWQWTRLWGTTASEGAWGVACDADGNIYVAGDTLGQFDSETNPGDHSYYLRKFNSSGSVLWTRIWGSSDTDTARGISVDNDNRIYVTGYSYGTYDGQTNAGSADITLSRFTPDGDREWTLIWGSSSAQYGKACSADNAGRVYVAGSTQGSFDGQSFGGSSDAFLSRVSDAIDANVVSIATTSNSAFVATGTTLTPSDFVIVTDPPGFESLVSVDPLTFPTAGVIRVIASLGASSATSTVSVLNSEDVLIITDSAELFTIPFATNGVPAFTTTVSRATFDQLVMMANALGSPLDSAYGPDWDDWANAQDVAKKSYIRGMLDVFQGLHFADVKARIFDPVNVGRGIFYVDEIDLVLPAPNPLEIRRSYSSDNLAPSDLGPGWHLSRNYFLFVNNAVFDLTPGQNLPTNAEVRVSEPDGTSVVYSRNSGTPATVLLVNANANASNTNAPLNNVNNHGIGARANLLNNRVEYMPTNRAFFVYDGQGGVRRYDWQSFGSTNDLNYRERPYLTYERLPNGNRIHFTYSVAGQPETIEATDQSDSTVFNSVTFEYNAQAKLRQITASDGRTVAYHYDSLGDLVRVVRPDDTEVSYGYEHFLSSGTPTNYSSHRIIRIEKPESRILENEFYRAGDVVDGEPLSADHYLVGRVKLQRVAQTAESSLVTNAWLHYSVVTNGVNVGSGFTEVFDALMNRTVYHLGANQQVTAVERYAKARDANGDPIMDGTNLTYVLHSAEKRYWDGVNLMRSALEYPSGHVAFNWGATYDVRGNLLSETVSGNLSGLFTGVLQFDTNGLPVNGESATTTYTYTFHSGNTNDVQNLMTSMTRVNGTVIRFEYVSPSNNSLAARFVCSPDGDSNPFNNPIYSREFYEYDANKALTRRITDDGTTTNSADLTGVTQRRIGDMTPGTSAPEFGLPVTVHDKFHNGVSEVALFRREITYDTRGNPTNVETYDLTNALLFTASFDYDLMNRQTFAQDAQDNATTYTYDDNGNLIGTDGARTNLTDTSTFVFDFSDRLLTTLRTDGLGNVLTNSFAYDAYGNEVARTNLHGQVTQAFYDDLHRRTKIVFPEIVTAESNNVAPTILSAYDIFDNLTALTDANSNTTTYAYNVRGDRTAVHYPDGTQERFTYDEAGRLIEALAPNDSYTVYQYDWLDRVTNRTIYAPNNTLLARYSTAHNAFNVAAQTDANTNTRTYVYDGAGRLVIEYGPGSTDTRSQIEYVYDDLSRVRERRVWFGTNVMDYAVTVYKHDNLGRTTSERVHDSAGTDLLKTEYVYDEAGNQTVLRGFPAAATNGAASVREYDALNNLLTLTDTLSRQTAWSYDYAGSGLQTTVTDPLTNKTITALDALGRVTHVERRSADDELLHKTEYRYDPNGNRTRAIDTVMGSGSNHTITTAWAYDSQNRETAMIEAFGAADERTTRYFYNEAGQLYSQKHPNGVELFHFYDPRGRLANLISADNSIRYRYTYDANNNVASVQDIVASQTTTRDYDAYNRIIAEKQATGLTVEYVYDRANRPTRMLLPGSNAVDYVYDAAFLTTVSRMTNVTAIGAPGSLAYQHAYTSYDLAANALGATLASGQSQTFQTDALNRRTLISSPAWTQTVSGVNGYDPAGNLRDFTVNDPGSSLNFTHTYDNLYQLASEAGLVSRSYTQDSIGNRLDIDGGATVYSYNDLNQLLLQDSATNVLSGTIRVPVAGLYGPTRYGDEVESIALQLDAGGLLSGTLYTNGIWEFVDGGLKGLPVPIDGSEHTVTVTATTTNSIENAKTVTVSYAATTLISQTYDRNGNRTQQIQHGSNAVVRTYSYDALNRLVQASRDCPTCDSYEERFTYDPFNRRIGKTVVESSATTSVHRFIWDGQNEIGAADAAGNLLQLRLLGQGLGREVGAAVAVELRTNAASAFNVYVPVHDHRGNVALLLNRSSGTVAEYYRYDAFGNAQTFGNTTGNPWRFASKRADTETGLIYFGSRYYDPSTGRFITADPLDFLDGANRYLYAQANPLILIDPSGLFAKDIYHEGFYSPLRGWAGRLDEIGMGSGDPHLAFYLGLQAEMLQLLAEAGTPAVYVDQYQHGVNRTSMVIYNAMESGDHIVYASLQGTSYALGNIIGYTPFIEGVIGIDIATAERLAGVDRVTRTAAGTGQLILSGVALGSAYNPAVKTPTTSIQKFFPENNGFLGQSQRQFLEPGQRIDRFGGTDASRFFSPAGTPAGARALPPGTSGQPLRTFEVVKPFEVDAGTVAPAFGQSGFGSQFRTPVPLETLLKREIIREVP